MNDHIKGLLITTLGVLFIVPDSLFIRLIDAGSLTISFWRSLISGVVILACLFAFQGRDTVRSIKATGKSGVFYGLFLGSSGLFFVVAIDSTSVANVVFILASMPVFAALYSRVLMGEPISPRMSITIVGVACGLAIIAFGTGQNESSGRFGDVMALASAASFAAAMTTARKARAVSMIPTLPFAYFATSLAVLPFTDIFAVVPGQWWLIAIHGGIIIVVSTSLLSLGPRYLTSAEVSLLMLLESVLAPLLVWYALGEHPGSWALIGGTVVVGVLMLSNLVVLSRAMVARRAP